MYYVSKRIEVAGSHALTLSYPSKCTRPHGHNWIITVYCKSAALNADGMVVDFSHIKEKIMQALDHQHLNDVLDFNPTAENIARWITDQFAECYKTEVQESQGNTAIYVDDALAQGAAI